MFKKVYIYVYYTQNKLKIWALIHDLLPAMQLKKAVFTLIKSLTIYVYFCVNNKNSNRKFFFKDFNSISIFERVCFCSWSIFIYLILVLVYNCMVKRLSIFRVIDQFNVAGKGIKCFWKGTYTIVIYTYAHNRINRRFHTELNFLLTEILFSIELICC